MRTLAKDALLAMDCHPILQDTFEPDYRKIHEVLREKIRACDAVIHIVGECYGEEPSPQTEPRRSYTQLEADLARRLGKKLYVFLCGEDFPYQSHAPESPEKQALQAAYREAVKGAQTLYTPVSSPEAFGNDLRELRIHSQLLSSALRTVVLLAAAVVVMAVILLAGVTLLSRQTPDKPEVSAPAPGLPPATPAQEMVGVPVPAPAPVVSASVPAYAPPVLSGGRDPFAGQWGEINASTGELALWQLFDVIDRVAFVHLGESADKLTRTVKAPGRDGFTEVVGIPISPAWKTLFVQLEMKDGTRSEVREIPVGDAFAQFAVLPLAPGSGPGAPEVFLNVASRFINYTPPEGTARELYHLGSGEWNTFSPNLSLLFSARHNHALDDHPQLHLMFLKEDGSSVGPFAYGLDPLFADEQQKKEKEMRLQARELVSATRIPFTLPIDEKADYAVRVRTEQSLQFAGIGYVKKAPVTVVRFRTDRSNLKLWSSVKQVRAGESADKLTLSADSVLRPDQTATQPDNFGHLGEILTGGSQILAPADWKRVFVQFEFRSGKSSEPFEVPIKDLKIAQ